MNNPDLRLPAELRDRILNLVKRETSFWGTWEDIEPALRTLPEVTPADRWVIRDELTELAEASEAVNAMLLRIGTGDEWNSAWDRWRTATKKALPPPLSATAEVSGKGYDSDDSLEEDHLNRMGG